MLKKVLITSVIVAVTSFTASGFVNQSSKVKFATPNKVYVETGGVTKFQVTAHVPRGRHIYVKKRNDKSVSIITSFDVDTDSGFQIGPVTPPAGKTHGNDYVLYNQGVYQVTLYDLGANRIGSWVKVPMTITTQACENDGSVCYPPVTFKKDIRAFIKKQKTKMKSRSFMNSRSSINWVTSYDKALKQSKAKGKNVYAVITAPDWCGACQYMEKYAFADNTVQKTLNEKFIALRILDTNPDKRKFDFRGYPTSVVLDETGKELYKKAGGMRANSLLNAIKKYETEDNTPDEPVTPDDPPAPVSPDINWQTKAADAFRLAKQQKKNVYLILTAPEWCTSCQWMESNAFAKPEIIKRLSDDYIPLKITDKNSEKGNYEFSGYPTSIFFSYTTQREMHRVTGGITGQSLAVLLDKYKGTTGDNPQPTPPDDGPGDDPADGDVSFRLIDKVALYGGANWNTRIKTIRNSSASACKAACAENNDCTFAVFNARGNLILGMGKNTLYKDCSLFRGKLWAGSAPQSDTYVKQKNGKDVWE